MQVFVLFYMMRYFSEYIVNMKKKVVLRYIYGCIGVYGAYFFLFLYGMFHEVGSVFSLSPRRSSIVSASQSSFTSLSTRSSPSSASCPANTSSSS